MPDYGIENENTDGARLYSRLSQVSFTPDRRSDGKAAPVVVMDTLTGETFDLDLRGVSKDRLEQAAIDSDSGQDQGQLFKALQQLQRPPATLPDTPPIRTPEPVVAVINPDPEEYDMVDPDVTEPETTELESTEPNLLAGVQEESALSEEEQALRDAAMQRRKARQRLKDGQPAAAPAAAKLPTSAKIRPAEPPVRSTDDLEPCLYSGGMETLQLPFLTGPQPLPPSKVVYLELGNMGTISARYHEVLEADICIVLVYDSRFEQGVQFLPATLPGSNLRVTAPSIGLKGVDCVTSGIQFALGVLEIAVLFKAEADRS